MFGISGDEFVEHGQVDVLVPGTCSEHHGRVILYEFLDESRFSYTMPSGDRYEMESVLLVHPVQCIEFKFPAYEHDHEIVFGHL